MSIPQNQKMLVRDSFSHVIPIADQAAGIFYERLFELDPSLRPLFKSDMAQQRRKLMQALQIAVQGLEDLDMLVPVLQKIAIRHIGYGVRNEHYATVGAALLWTLGQGLGKGFTEEVEEAWIAVYTLMSSVMIEATAEVVAS